MQFQCRPQNIVMDLNNVMMETLQIVCSPKVTFCSRVDTGISFEDPALVQTRSFCEIYIDDNLIGSQVCMLNE
jgi:hypothetical protein